MTRILLRKYFGESALLWAACAATLVAFNVLRIWFVSLIELDRFKTIVNQFREYEQFSPVPFEQMFTYAGRIGMAFDEPIVVLCIVVWVISRSSDVVSGELGRGTMEMVLSHPITRNQLIFAHGIVATVGLAALSFCVWLGIWIGVASFSTKQTPPQATLYIPVVGINLPLPEVEREPIYTPMSEVVSAEVFGVGCLNMFAFGFALLGVGTLFSAMDRYRWRAVGVTIAFYIMNLIVHITSMASADLSWLRFFTYFSCYKPAVIVQYNLSDAAGSVWQLWVRDSEGLLSIGPLGMTLVMLAVGAAGYLLALRHFNQRDLPAPV